MKLRQAKQKDLDYLLYLRNDDQTILNSFNKTKVKLDDHVKWFNESLANKNRKIWIFENDLQPLGMIREDFNDNQITLSWVIDPMHRGLGLGTIMLSTLIKDRNESFIANIKKDNFSSIRIVEKNGFELISSDSFLTYKKIGAYEIIDKIENVRTRNNVNWMDVLRLAFKNSPNEAKEIVGRINSQDNEISDLLNKLSK